MATTSSPQIGPSSAASLNASTYGTSSSNLSNYLGSKGMGTDTASINTLWTGAFGSTTPYTGSAAQNAALLHAVQTGYKPGVNNATVSGSATMKQNQNTNSAMTAASKNIGGNPTSTPAVTPGTPGTPGTPATPVSTIMSPGVGATISATDIANIPSGLQSLATGYNAGVALNNQTMNDQLTPATNTYNANRQVLLNQQADAVAAAKATYAAANPNGFGSDEDSYVNAVTSSFDTQIQNLDDSFSASKSQLVDENQAQNLALQQTLQANVSTYYANNQANFQSYIKDYGTPEITGNTDPSTLAGQSNLLQWAENNAGFVSMAGSTGQYGDIVNADGSLNTSNTTALIQAAAQLSQPSATDIKEQTEEETAGAAGANATAHGQQAEAATTQAQVSVDAETLKEQQAAALTITSKSASILAPFIGSTSIMGKVIFPKGVTANGYAVKNSAGQSLYQGSDGLWYTY